MKKFIYFMFAPQREIKQLKESNSLLKTMLQEKYSCDAIQLEKMVKERELINACEIEIDVTRIDIKYC